MILKHISRGTTASFIYDTDFQNNVINVAVTNGFTLPSSAKLQAMNAVMLEMKASGMWAELDTYVYFATNDTTLTNFRRIDWKRNGVLYTINGGVTTELGGFRGNTVNGYIDTNYNPSTSGVNYLTDDASRGFVIYQASTASYIDGVTTAGAQLTRNRNSSVADHKINQSAGVHLSATVDFSGTGLMSINRDNSNDLRFIKGGTVSNRTAASIGIASENQFIFRSGSNYGDPTLSCYWMGGSLTNAMISSYRTAFNTCLTTIGLSAMA